MGVVDTFGHTSLLSGLIFFRENFYWKDSINFQHLKMTENQNFEMFEEVVHNFVNSDSDII